MGGGFVIIVGAVVAEMRSTHSLRSGLDSMVLERSSKELQLSWKQQMDRTFRSNWERRGRGNVEEEK